MTRHSLKPAGAALCATLVAAVAGCASMPPPNERIAVARASVQRAEQAGAPELAPVELSIAREKISRAERAAADHDNEAAAMLAEQADVDAQLAEAASNQQRSRKAAMEFDASMQALRRESTGNADTTH